MADGLRTVWVITTDESLLASARGAVKALEGWEFAHASEIGTLLTSPPVAGDAILIDGRLGSENAYEGSRRLAGRTRCRTFVVVDTGNDAALPIARFCGATGVLFQPLTAAGIREQLEGKAAAGESAQVQRAAKTLEGSLPSALLRDMSGGEDASLISAVTDPETNLFNFAYLNFKLDEEFKRALRFSHPLACVMLGFEGQASEQVLRELAGIFLLASRDTDVLGRFDENSFLFLLPSTGQDGAQIMAQRVEELAQKQGLRDLVGDPLQIAVGIAVMPHPDVQQKEDLFSRAREAFFAARQEGGGVVTSV